MVVPPNPSKTQGPVAALAPKRKAVRPERAVPAQRRVAAAARRAKARARAGLGRAQGRARVGLRQPQGRAPPVAARAPVQFRAQDAIASASVSAREGRRALGDRARGCEWTPETPALARLRLAAVATTKINFRGTWQATAADFFGLCLDALGSARGTATSPLASQLPASAQLARPSSIRSLNVMQISPSLHGAVLTQSCGNHEIADRLADSPARHGQA